MSRIDELPPDQRATLSLLLRQRKSYREVAAMLRISPQAVHDRAHAALAVLAPREARALDPAWRLEIGDYLLGQQAGVAERLRTRTYLAGSAPARDWARAVAQEIAPLSNGQPLPEIPPGSPGADTLTPAADSTHTAPEREDAQYGQLPPSQPISRLGGALILAAIVVAIVVAVVLLTTGGGSKDHTKTKSTAKTSTAKVPAVRQIVLRPATAGSHSVGVVEILSEAGKHAFYIEADKIPASDGFYYAIWLVNGPHSAEPLSRAPTVGKTHRLAGGALLPTNASRFHKILLTRETEKRPTHPGPIVLEGKFSL